MDDRVKVLLVDDNDDFATLFKLMIERDRRLEYLGHASDKENGVEMSVRLSPDIVVMDLNLCGDALDGIEAAREIRVLTGIRIVLLTAYEEQETIINASRKAFASGYVFKSRFQTIADIIYDSATSNTPEKEMIRELALSRLSSAERGVFEDILKGTGVESLYQSPSTISNQKTNIFKKLGLKNTKELLRVFNNW